MPNPRNTIFATSATRRLSLALGALAAAGSVAVLRLVASRPGVNVWERTVGIHARLPVFDSSPYGRGLDILLTGIVPLLALGAAYVLWRRFRAGERRLAVGCAVFAGGAFVTTELLKLTLPHRQHVPPRFDAGYPSGHTTVAYATALVLAAALPGARRRLPVGLGYAAFVAAGVLVDGWHLPLDPLGALGVVTAWLLAVAAALDPPLRLRETPSDVWLAVVGAAVALIVLLTRLGVPAHESFPRATIEAAALAAGATVATGLLVARLVSR